MVENVFGQNPVARALDESDATLRASEPTYGAPAPDQDPKSQFEALARSSRVPVNVLMAIGEAAGTDPVQGLSIAKNAAARLAPLIAAGKKPADALLEALGPQGADASSAIMKRAWAIAGQLYPQKPATPDAQAPVPQAGLIRKGADAAVAVGEGVLNDGIVGGIRGIGALAAATENTLVLNPVNAVSQAIAGKDIAAKARNPTTNFADWASAKLQAGGDYLTSDSTKEDIANSQITGDIMHPSTISMGKDPSLNGILQQAVRTFGSMAGMVLAAYASGGSEAVGAGMGMISAAGDQAQSSDQAIDQMAQTKMPDGRSQLETESLPYQQYLAKGLAPADALAATKDDASQLAALFSAPVGAIGGGIEAKIFHPAEKILEKSNMASRIATRAAMGAVSEGAQESSEGAAGVVGMNQGAGTHADPWEGSAGNAILGALGGGFAGAGAGAASPGHVEENTPPSGGAPNADLPPLNDSPTGPLTEAARLANPNSTTGFAPGMKFNVDPGEGHAPFEAEFVRDTAFGPIIGEADGTETTIPREHLNSGRVRMTPLDGGQGATPDAAPGAGPDATDAPQTETAAPVEPDLTPFGMKDGKPFPNAKQAARGGMSRLGHNQFTIHAVDGGFMVAPLPPQAAQEAPIPSATEGKPNAPVPDQAVETPAGEASFTPSQPRPNVGQTPNAEAPFGPADDAGAQQAQAPQTPATGPVIPEATDDGKESIEGGQDPSPVAADQQVGGQGPAKVAAGKGPEVADPQRPGVLPDGAGVPPGITDAKPDGALTARTDELNTLADRAAVKLAGGHRINDGGKQADFIENNDEVRLGAGKSKDGKSQFLAIFHGGAEGKMALTDAFTDYGTKAVTPRQTRKVLDVIHAAYPEFHAPAAEQATIPMDQVENVAQIPDGVAVSDNPPPPKPDLFDNNKGHRDAIQALTDQKYGDFAKHTVGDRLSAINFHAQYTKGFEKLAPKLLVQAGSTRPSNIELNAELKKASIGHMQNGLTVNFNHGDPALRAWTQVYAAELGYNPFKGRFRTPTKAFVDFLGAAKAKPDQTTIKQNPPQEQGPVEKPTDSAPTGQERPVAEPDHAAAIEEAAGQVATNPTDGQKEAGNYQKGHLAWNGLDLTLENAKGSERSGTSPDGTAWSVTMPAHYGYFKGTEGTDGDHVDFYLGDAPKSDKVLVVDQMDLATGRFDEHKVMIGFATGKEARAAYIDGFSDGKGANRIGGAKLLTVEEFKAWLTSPAMKLPITEQAKATDAKKGPKLQDFGQKIGGARKDRSEKSIEDLRADRVTKTMTLTEAFPEPDYEALAASGIPSDRVAFVALMRASIERKPMSSWKVQNWAERVDRYRNAAVQALATVTPLDTIAKEAEYWKGGQKDFASILGVVSAMPADMIGEAARFTFLPDTTHFAYEKDPKTGLTITIKTKVFGISAPNLPSHRIGHEFPMDQLDRIPGYIKDWITRDRAARAEEGKAAPTRKPVELELQSYVSKNGAKLFRITFKIRDHVTLAGPFATMKAAQDYRRDHGDALQALANTRRDGLIERRTTNEPRNGPKFRTGNATPEMFTKAFGFRGVEFGNWNTGTDRQTGLNEAYDALMDLAGALGIPTEAISLNGKLGLAFGSRGNGGRRSAAAHYEPTAIAINLTKNSGAGSLAHEWWHAVDNHLAKIDAADSNVAAVYGGKSATRRNEYMSNRSRYRGAMPDAGYQAFRNLENALVGPTGAWFKRSVEADKSRSEPYFSTVIELSARGFEKIIYDRLASRGMNNDFLVNINDSGGAYPTTAEARRQGVTGAMNAVLEGFKAQFVETGSNMVDLPPIQTEMLEDGPQAGFEWESLNGPRKIIARDGNDLTLEYTNLKTGEVVVKTGFDVATIEDLIDRDAYSLTDDGRAEAAVEATAKELAAEKAAANAKTEADAEAQVKLFIEDSRLTGHSAQLAAAALRRGVSLRAKDRMSIAATLLAFIHEGGSVQKRGSEKENFYLSGGGYYKPGVWESHGIMFAKWYGKVMAAEAKRAAESLQAEIDAGLTDAEAAHLFGDKPSSEPASEPDQTPEAAPGDTEPTDVELKAALDAARAAMQAEADAATAAKPTVGASTEEAWDNADDAARKAMLVAGGMSKAAADRNVGRDWKDLTDTAKKAATGATRPRTAGEAAANAAQNLVDGFKASAAALNSIFTMDPNKLSSNPLFDPEVYARAKPHFVNAIRAFGRAGMDLMELASALTRGMAAAGVTLKAQELMDAYLMRYLRDVVNGTQTPFATVSSPNTPETATVGPAVVEATDEQGTTGPDVSGRMEESQPESVPGARPGVSENGSLGTGGSGAGGNQSGGVAGATTGAGLVGSGGAVSGNEVSAEPERDPEGLKGDNPGDFTITPDFKLGEGTDGEKLAGNIAAITLVKQLIADNRYATKAEQAVLARYVGWGGLKSAFDAKNAKDKGQWGRAYQFLKTTLTKDEYSWARESTLNAHYTSRGVVGAMWKAMEHFGFKGGRALEPTIGTGNFIGLQPVVARASTEWHATEIDPLTGQMAGFLYPSAKVHSGRGFQDVPFAKGAFDIAIGNPPFGSERIRSGVDKTIAGMKIHNYIISKSATHLRPGGIMAVVVTHRFLDTADSEARDHLAKDFKFLGALRLPNNAFKENAGTDVVTDVVFMQKLVEGENPNKKADWLKTDGSITVDGVAMRVNGYFAKNPAHILGRSAMDGSMYGKAATEGEYTVHSDGRDVNSEIEKLLASGALGERGALGDRNSALENSLALETVSTMPIGRMILAEDGKIYRRLMDDHAGARVIKVGPETPWRDGGEDWGRGLDTLRKVLTASKLGMVETAEIAYGAEQDLRSALAGEIYGKDGKPTASKTAAQVFVREALDALKTGNSRTIQTLKWEGLAAVEAKVQRMKLGEDNYQRLRGMLDLRAKTLALIHAEANNARNIENLRNILNDTYDAFVSKNGFVNNPANAKLMRNDTGQPFGLESSYTAKDGTTTESAKKAPILSKRMIFPHVAPTTAANTHDAVTISLQERGKIDLGYMSRLTGVSPELIRDELMAGDHPSIYFDPKAQDYVEASEYLSGNVKGKHEEAIKSGLAKNAAALAEVFPADRTQSQITPTIRALWIPAEVYKDYLERLGVKSAKIIITPEVGRIEANGMVQNLTQDGAQFAHSRRDVLQIFTAASSGKKITITNKGADGKEVVDEEATTQVNALAEQMSKDFEAWAYDNPDRAALIARAFNEKINLFAPRAYDGKNMLKTVGGAMTESW